jgi:predicted CopG family antitoxin
MSSRNIAVQKGVYDALVREKRAGESFTVVLRRMLDQRRSIEELGGAWGSAGAKADKTRLNRLRQGGPAR